MTDEIVALAQSEAFDKEQEEAAFRFTFERLAETLQDSSFNKFDLSKDRFLGGFLVSVYEVLALGLGANYEAYEDGAEVPDVKKIAQQLWSDEKFLYRTGSGIRASSRIPFTILMGREYLRS